jgi:hypothetical protein
MSNHILVSPHLNSYYQASNREHFLRLYWGTLRVNYTRHFEFEHLNLESLTNWGCEWSNRFLYKIAFLVNHVFNTRYSEPFTKVLNRQPGHMAIIPVKIII